MAEQVPRTRFRHLRTRAVSVIGHQEWLDRPSCRFEHLLSFAYNATGGARDRIANALNGVWLGHPVHPPLPSLTTGAIGTTGALDALTILPGRPKSEVVDASRFASRARGPGIVANLGSALTGVTDWQHTHERDRRIGLVHGLLSIVATVFYIVSWWNRRRGRHLRIGISALGYGITVGSGYVGGALVFDSGIGIDRSGERLHTADWTAVLPVASLQDGKPQRVDGVGVVLCRSSDGRVSAFGEFCLHLAAPMSDGWVDRGSIVCPWHGSRFDIESGEVVPGPSAAPPPRYQTRISDGVIELRGDGQHATAAPRGVRK